MPPTLSQEEAKRRVSVVRDDCELIWYAGYVLSKESIFKDFEYGEFKGRLIDVLNGQKNHPTRSKLKFSTNAKNPATIEKRKQTNIQKYGGPTPFHNKAIQKQAKATQKAKWGVDNISQHPEIKQKKKETCLKNWNVENPSQSHIVMEKKMETFIERGIKINVDDELIDPHYLRTLNKGQKWSKKIKKRDGNVCQKCFSTEKPNAHHILNWMRYPSHRFDLDNGITLCQKCHNRFHKIYGVNDNNRQQLEEFLKK